VSTTAVMPTLETWTLATPDSVVVYHRRTLAGGRRGLPTAGRWYPRGGRNSRSLSDDELAALIEAHGGGRQMTRRRAH
jgi:hypothetical protein